MSKKHKSNNQIEIDINQAVFLAEVTLEGIQEARQALVVKHENRRKFWSQNATPGWQKWSWRQFKFFPMTLAEMEIAQKRKNEAFYFGDSTDGFKGDIMFYTNWYKTLETKCKAIVQLKGNDKVDSLLLCLDLHQVLNSWCEDASEETLAKYGESMGY